MEEYIRAIWSNALDDETERRYGMMKHHPTEDCPQWFIDSIQKEIDGAVNEKVEEVRREILEVLACYISYGTTDEIKAVNDILKFPSLSTNNTQ